MVGGRTVAVFQEVKWLMASLWEHVTNTDDLDSCTDALFFLGRIRTWFRYMFWAHTWRKMWCMLHVICWRPLVVSTSTFSESVFFKGS